MQNPWSNKTSSHSVYMTTNNCFSPQFNNMRTWNMNESFHFLEFLIFWARVRNGQNPPYISRLLSTFSLGSHLQGSERAHKGKLPRLLSSLWGTKQNPGHPLLLNIRARGQQEQSPKKHPTGNSIQLQDIWKHLEAYYHFNIYFLFCCFI